MANSEGIGFEGMTEGFIDATSTRTRTRLPRSDVQSRLHRPRGPHVIACITVGPCMTP